MKILESGSSGEKIAVLATLDDVDDLGVIDRIISKLDDEDIMVRGEAYRTLLANENNVRDCLVNGLKAKDENTRGTILLILANRGDKMAIPDITKLINDEHPWVRSCALGALEYLRV